MIQIAFCSIDLTCDLTWRDSIIASKSQSIFLNLKMLNLCWKSETCFVSFSDKGRFWKAPNAWDWQISVGSHKDDDFSFVECSWWCALSTVLWGGRGIQLETDSDLWLPGMAFNNVVGSCANQRQWASAFFLFIVDAVQASKRCQLPDLYIWSSLK